METPLQVSFHDVPVTDEIEHVCLREAERLERFHSRITGCHVLISRPHRRHRKGNPCHVRVNVVIPGGEVVANHSPHAEASDETLALAVRETFATVRRSLVDTVRRRRGAFQRNGARPHRREGRPDALRNRST